MVNPAFLVITVNDSTKVVGTTADLSTVGFTSAGLVNGETISSVVLTSPGAVNTALVANYSITANTPRGNSAFLASNYLVSDIDGTLSVIATPPTTPSAITTTPAANSNPANTVVYLQSSVQSSLKTAKDDFVYQAISSKSLLVNTNLNSIETSNNWTTAYWNSSIQIFNSGINTSLSEDNFNAH